MGNNNLTDCEWTYNFSKELIISIVTCVHTNSPIEILTNLTRSVNRRVRYWNFGETWKNILRHRRWWWLLQRVVCYQKEKNLIDKLVLYAPSRGDYRYVPTVIWLRWNTDRARWAFCAAKVFAFKRYRF